MLHIPKETIDTAISIKVKNGFWLDLVRCLAALMVLVCHARGTSLPEFGLLDASQKNISVTIFYAVFRAGYGAVITFFVLSGYLVLGKVFQRLKSGTFDWHNYAIDRATRIFIPLIPAVIVSYVVNWFMNGQNISVLSASLHMLGLNGVFGATVVTNGALWSLSYEIWFYILAGVTAKILVQRQIGAIDLLLIGFGLYVFCILEPLFLLFWTIGGLFSLSAKKLTTFEFGFALLLILSGLGLTELTEESRSAITLRFISQEMAAIPLVLGLAAILPTLNASPADMVSDNIRALVKKLSQFSYSIYIFHYPVLILMTASIFPRAQRFDASSLAIFMFKIAICIFVSWLFYVLFESQTTTVRAKLKQYLLRSQRPFAR